MSGLRVYHSSQVSCPLTASFAAQVLLPLLVIAAAVLLPKYLR